MIPDLSYKNNILLNPFSQTVLSKRSSIEFLSCTDQDKTDTYDIVCFPERNEHYKSQLKIIPVSALMFYCN